MPINRRPGNEPDARDMTPEFDPAAETGGTPPADPAALAEEEEAAKLGDFA